MLHDLREYDLSDAAWREALDADDRDGIATCVDRFLDGAAMTARWIRRLTRATEADAVIVFVAGGGLERNVLAAKIARREYGVWLTTMPPIPAGEIVEQLVFFYQRLGTVFGEQGVAV